MEKVLLMPKEIIAVRNHTQQLKVLMNLPVRLVSEDQVIDVLPIEQPALTRRRKSDRPYPTLDDFPTPNQLIDFFKKWKHDELVTPREVAVIYNVSQRTIATWAQKGLLSRFKLAPGLTLYKRLDLPSLDKLYGPFEL